jgi:predicted ATPase
MLRMMPTSGRIRTPDQRLRVFVSSTLSELAPERKSARGAVERLHLAPVMFELGARPHPPRDLYRAYLAQSDVFVGIYGERYGWVAPGESVSGLEDEYNLAPALPKLIYIKNHTTRDPRLTELLDRVRDDDGASYALFSTPSELRSLLEADLATLLAERFEQSKHPAPAARRERPGDPTTATVPDARATPIPPTVPSPVTDLIGRSNEVRAIERMLGRTSTRLVTLTGPGGIGKTRLAVAVLNRARIHDDGEFAFVDLAPVTNPALVPNAIAQALGVLDTGDEPLGDKLTTALRERKMLIVLDNFEQVLDAAATVTALLAAAPGLAFLVTSRALLRVSGEHTFEVGPLGLPDPGRPLEPRSRARAPAVALFVERARAVKPDFEVTAGNTAAIEGICVALDGVPLALELAAARIRVLTPEEMLARLDRRLPLLEAGARDLPARQRTLRNTIEWSTQLLEDSERSLLATLGVFAGGFSLDAVEFVTAAMPGPDALAGLGALVDNSLVREQDRGDGRSHFSMLATVREYALEQLESSGAIDHTRERHAGFYVGLGGRIEFELEGPLQSELVERLNDERGNLRAAARYLLDLRDWTSAADFAWTLYIYWWIGGMQGEVRGWLTEVLTSGAALSDRTRAIALYFTCSITLWQDPKEWVEPGLTEGAELFRRVDNRSGEGLTLISLALAILAADLAAAPRARDALETSLRLLRDCGDNWGEAMALITLGRVALIQQDLAQARECFEESLSLTRLRHEKLGTAIALHHLGWVQLAASQTAEAQDSFEQALSLSAQLRHIEGVAYGLEGLIAVAAATLQVERAGRLLRAAEGLRRQTGLFAATSFSFHEHFVAPLRVGEHRAEFEAARTTGPELTTAEAVAYALNTPDSPAVDTAVPGQSARRP